MSLVQWLTWPHRTAALCWGWEGDWTRRCRTGGDSVLLADFPSGWRCWPHRGKTPCRAMPGCRTTPTEVETSIERWEQHVEALRSLQMSPSNYIWRRHGRFNWLWTDNGERFNREVMKRETIEKDTNSCRCNGLSQISFQSGYQEIWTLPFLSHFLHHWGATCFTPVNKRKHFCILMSALLAN